MMIRNIINNANKNVRNFFNRAIELTNNGINIARSAIMSAGHHFLYASEKEAGTSLRSWRNFVAGTEKLVTTIFPGYLIGLFLTDFTYRPIIYGVSAFLGLFSGRNTFLYRLTNEEKYKEFSRNAGLWLKTMMTIFNISMGVRSIIAMLFGLSGEKSIQESLNDNTRNVAFAAITYSTLLGLCLALMQYKRHNILSEKNVSGSRWTKNKHAKAAVKSAIQTSRILAVCIYLTGLNDAEVNDGYIAGYVISGPVVYTGFYLAYLLIENHRPIDYFMNSLNSLFSFMASIYAAGVTSQLGMSYSKYDDRVTAEMIIGGAVGGITYGALRAASLWSEFKEDLDRYYEENKRRRNLEVYVSPNPIYEMSSRNMGMDIPAAPPPQVELRAVGQIEESQQTLNQLRGIVLRANSSQSRVGSQAALPQNRLAFQVV